LGTLTNFKKNQENKQVTHSQLITNTKTPFKVTQYMAKKYYIHSYNKINVVDTRSATQETEQQKWTLLLQQL